MRRWARAVALVLLVASARLPHAAQDDQACASVFGGGASHDQSALAAGSASQPDHCAICHWTRLLRSPLTPVGVTTASLGPATVVLRHALPLVVDPDDDLLPARAPPALL